MNEYQFHTTAVSHWQDDVLKSALMLHKPHADRTPAEVARWHANAVEGYAKAVAAAEAAGYSVDNTAYVMAPTPVLATA